MSDLSLRPRGSTEIVDAAFRLYRQHFVPLVTVSALVYLPVLVVNIVWGLVTPPTIATSEDASGGMLTTGPIPGSLLLAMVALSLLWAPTLWASLVVAFSERYLGREIDAGTAVSTALSRYGPVTGSSVLKMILYIVGSLLFLIPGIYLYLRYFAVPATAVLERNTTSGALQRSSVLSRGIKMKVLGTLLLAVLLVAVIWIAILMLAGLSALILPPRAAGLAIQIAGPVAQILLIPFIVAVETLLYYDARIRQEGFDIQVMSAALDPVSGAAPAT